MRRSREFRSRRNRDKARPTFPPPTLRAPPMAIDRLAHVGRALISVSDKSGLTELGLALAARKVEIVSTGGTASALTKAGVAVVDVAQLTGFPEMMDGRLKTLHPRVHGGLLAIRSDPSHQAAMIAHGIAPIDLLVVNLYPFENALAARRAVRGDDREHRHRRPGDDSRRGEESRRRRRDRRRRGLSAPARGTEAPTTARRGSSFRREMAQKAYARTAAYDAAISNWLARETRQRRAGVARVRRQARERNALRREPAPERRFLRRAGVASRRRHGAPGPGQGALLQQHQRHRRGLRAGRRIRSRGVRRGGDHQARQPLRRRDRRDACSRPTRRRWPAIPSPPSAASSRSTARSTRRRRARSSRSSPR